MTTEGKDLDEINATLSNLRVTERGTILVKETDTWLVEVTPMNFTDRLVLTPKSSPQVWYYGWCFEASEHCIIAILAATAFDPETEREPVGFIKRVGGDRRITDVRERSS